MQEVARPLSLRATPTLRERSRLPGIPNTLADPSKESVLQRIIAYNEDDCRAMVAVKGYFEQASMRDG
ncbi:hypothetical protein NITMOv2_2934 [Nitrospira moscoviensis]|uniref:Transposase n=1 Tax=Nitrospira moscoviensis TaxID=42253 RepID=A0A0K2GEP6_NITMO|nr:hypothetical protein NITMOv2_2934 [Nitrospira moscoviensis]